MKHIIIISIGLLFLASCSKTPKCWDCTRTVTNLQLNTTVVHNNKVCDMSKEQMKQFTKVNTNGNDKIKVVTECR